MNIKDLLKNKFFLTAAGISIFVLILVLLLSPKKNVTSIPTPSTSSALSNLSPINLSAEKRDALIAYTNSIKHKLPLTLESFDTSVGIETAINISHHGDLEELVNLSIGGLSYINKNELDESKNPNLTAFKESFLKAIEMLEGQNIDPKKLLFSYSDVPYVRETAQYWVDKLDLLR
jgi:hypothetical protein